MYLAIQKRPVHLHSTGQDKAEKNNYNTNTKFRLAMAISTLEVPLSKAFEVSEISVDALGRFQPSITNVLRLSTFSP